MDGLLISLVALLGVASCSRDLRSGSVLEVTVRPGDNVTVYCDCKVSRGVYIVWYRDCSHENQPSLVLKVKEHQHYFTNRPHFTFVRNSSSDSYDLLIVNITDSNEGLYYCGTEQKIVEFDEYLPSRMYYKYGNVTTRILFDSGPDPCEGFAYPGRVVSWMMVFTAAFTIPTSVLSFILVYYVCQKADKESQVLQERPDPSGPRRRDQDEDACFTRVVFRPKGWTNAPIG
ncbi:uncharacterized protein LOC117739329 [Cyclopterus lumpus]|uniref:uncharacterized protein LOC117739329 n=1 Tax=Cyclopterus lumpus TaxID=8103 RepID=UPI0014862447|nr:uncharacterized protein LOC117739329 [Cyclopterus lumpus]